MTCSTGVPSLVQLAAYKKLKEEAARRDHRKLGTQLDLFSVSDESVGGGLVFWHPKGAMVRAQCCCGRGGNEVALQPMMLLLLAHARAACSCTQLTLRAQVRHLIESHWKDLHLARGYQLLYTPHIAKVDLWKTSGHFDFYRESMFDQVCLWCMLLCPCMRLIHTDAHWCTGTGTNMPACSCPHGRADGG